MLGLPSEVERLLEPFDVTVIVGEDPKVASEFDVVTRLEKVMYTLA